MEEVKCFRCWEIGYLKCKCSNIEVEKKKRREEEVAHVARLQKVQQKRRLVCPVWEKAQEYCEEESMPSKGTLLLERGQIIREMMATYVDCRGYEGKGVQTYKNQGQGFLLER